MYDNQTDYTFLCLHVQRVWITEVVKMQQKKDLMLQVFGLRMSVFGI